MSWYKTGTITVNNASAAVTGSGTAWIANAAAGEAIYLPDGKFYEIASVNSDTSLTLASNYTGTSLAGQSYTILPSQSFIRDLAAQAAALINNYASIANNAGAGKFGDGTLGAPGITFASDTNTGLYRIGADNIGVAINGAKVLDVSAGGLTVSTADLYVPLGEVRAKLGFRISDDLSGGGNGLFSGSADSISSANANIKLKSWYGFGIATSYGAGAVPFGENAWWVDTRTGNSAQRGSHSVIAAGGKAMLQTISAGGTDEMPIYSLVRTSASEWSISQSASSSLHFSRDPSAYTDAALASSAKMTLDLSGNLTTSGHMIQSPQGTVTVDLSGKTAGTYYTLIPTGTFVDGAIYRIKVRWDHGGSGAPYIATCSLELATCGTNNDFGNGNVITPVTSTHVGGNYYFSFAAIAGPSSTSGLKFTASFEGNGNVVATYYRIG